MSSNGSALETIPPTSRYLDSSIYICHNCIIICKMRILLNFNMDFVPLKIDYNSMRVSGNSNPEDHTPTFTMDHTF